MGGAFDFFGPISWPDSRLAPADKRANRLLLRTLMIKYGFNPYKKEWWHFTLANEPFSENVLQFSCGIERLKGPCSFRMFNNGYNGKPGRSR